MMRLAATISMMGILNPGAFSCSVHRFCWRLGFCFELSTLETSSNFRTVSNIALGMLSMLCYISENIFSHSATTEAVVVQICVRCGAVQSSSASPRLFLHHLL